MKIKFLSLALIACSAAASPNYNYTITATLPDESLDGNEIFIVNYDNGDTIATSVIDATNVEFSGTIIKPVAANLSIGKRKKLFILEPGNISFDDRGLSHGTMLNDSLSDFLQSFHASLITLQNKANDSSLSKAQQDSLMQEIISLRHSRMETLFKSNLDNPLGNLGFIALIEDMNAARIDSLLAESPAIYGEYHKVKQTLQKARNTEATEEGKPFTDFTITDNNGSVSKLSDYVGKGTPVIVDFWASWCGPCRKEIETLKTISQKYGGVVQILGIAVWDEPDATAEAIEELGITWQQITNAQSIPTDLYNIKGIPHVIIFDGDGTILSRGLHDTQLLEKVEEIVNRF